MILTALEADLVELVSACHLLLGRVHRAVAHRALGRLGRLERHPEQPEPEPERGLADGRASEGGDGEESTEDTDMAAAPEVM